MMKRFNFNTATKAMLGAGLLSLLLTGCGGSDGKDGEDGKPGVVGVNINSTSTLKAKFTNATVDAGKVTVNFTLENANGVAVLGLNKTHDLRFGIAQLTPVKEKVGESEADRGLQWQAYINAKKEPGTVPPGVDNLKPSAQFQANVESASKCETCLVDNGDGSYSYTYQANIANVTSPVAVTYNADYTQRATLELELPQVVANAHLDWQPSTGKTEGIASRNVVSIETCYTCHQPESLALHGGRRIDIENCASCHTATSGDPESGNSIDFTYMIHAIHKGGDRKTFDATNAEVPAPYKIIGYGGKVIDYSKVNFPQKPAADCAACHVEGTNAPANADLFKADLSNTACIACHTEKPSAHHTKTDCVSCHNATKPYGGTNSAAKRHGDVLKAYNVSLDYKAKFSNISIKNNALIFDVQILDEKDQPIAKEFISDPSAYTKSSIYFSWGIDKDYPAYTAGSTYSDRSFALSNSKVSTYNEATKTFTINSTNSNLKLPADLTSMNVEFYAGVATCFNKGGYGIEDVVATPCSTDTRYAYIQDQPFRFKWNGTDTNSAAEKRRAIIDTAKCSGCHNKEIVHYDNGVNCQTCHTPDKALKETVRNSAKFDQATSFAWKAHEAEGHYLKYAGVQSGTVLKTDCSTCHTDDGIQLGRAKDRVWNYPNMETFDKAGVWVSSDAGACLSCHQKYLSDAAKSHIETNGGILDAIKAEDARTMASESCATCHTPSQLMEAHGN